jgi:NADH-quinone oxidoreductase subunit L
LYERLLVRPFVAIARANRNDAFDRALDAVPASLRGIAELAGATQTGTLRWYAGVAAAGVVVLIAATAFL